MVEAAFVAESGLNAQLKSNEIKYCNLLNGKALAAGKEARVAEIADFLQQSNVFCHCCFY